jgi:hypothetical protein
VGFSNWSAGFDVHAGDDSECLAKLRDRSRATAGERRAKSEDKKIRPHCLMLRDRGNPAQTGYAR